MSQPVDLPGLFEKIRSTTCVSKKRFSTAMAAEQLREELRDEEVRLYSFIMIRKKEKSVIRDCPIRLDFAC